MKEGDKVILTDSAKQETYNEMIWCNDIMVITDVEKDSEGLGDIYSFDSLSSDNEITCSMYKHELIKC